MNNTSKNHKFLREKDKVRLYDLYDLVEFRDFNKLMSMKIGQLVSEELTETIAQYNRKKDEWLQLLAKGLRQEGETAENEDYPPIFCFELTQFAKDDWGVTDFDPYLPDQIPYSDLLPYAFIQVLATFCKEREMNQVHDIEEEVYSEEFNKKVKLKFVQLSDTHIVGAIREIVEPEMLKVPDNLENADKVEHPYQVLHYYLYRYPDLRQTFLIDFLNELLPALKMIEAREVKRKQDGKEPGGRSGKKKKTSEP